MREREEGILMMGEGLKEGFGGFKEMEGIKEKEDGDDVTCESGECDR